MREGSTGAGHPLCGEMTAVLELMGKRWTAEVLHAGRSGARRFTEYRRAVPGVSDRLLSLRLKELQGWGLVVRTVAPSTPVQVRYAPTPRGEELLAAMRGLGAWGQRHFGDEGQEERRG
ncbi:MULTISPECIES: helix-turn-helix domain-containing protein [Actinosynnema]|uniref:winged helix-turn-helix transcriptional regulator n=1 Tax=Actinosynnema TaxID=40566 RepID=UPI0020A4242C|nr:helix-turn-helix domain-containing protein [Actinosynnema pretiosum]MCP2092108.1 transcriptional regulator, HxlR family [Actinosynnema pretiosum]